MAHEAEKKKLNELAHEACCGKPEIERYESTECYKRNIYKGTGKKRRLVHKAGEPRHHKGDPVLYYKGKRRGEPKMVYPLDNRVVGEIMDLIYPYCRQSVIRSFGWEDLEMITDLQIWVVDLLRREGPEPLGKPFSDLLPLRVNNYLTYKFQRARVAGLTEEIMVKDGSGEWYETEVLMHPWAYKRSLDETPPGFREPLANLIGGEDRFDRRIEAQSLIEQLRERVPEEMEDHIDAFLEGEVSRIPSKVRRVFQAELTALTGGVL